MIGLFTRLERAAEAFMTTPAPRLMPGRVAQRHEKTTLTVAHPLTDDERSTLHEQALGLMDSDVRGWLIVVVRAEHGGYADIDVDARIPAGVLPGVTYALAEVIG